MLHKSISDAWEGDTKRKLYEEKLQKVLARAGHGSRREIESLLKPVV